MTMKKKKNSWAPLSAITKNSTLAALSPVELDLYVCVSLSLCELLLQVLFTNSYTLYYYIYFVSVY